MRFPTLAESAAADEPLRLLSQDMVMAVSGVNLALLAAALIDARHLCQSRGTMRRASLAGIALALVALGLIQFGAYKAYGIAAVQEGGAPIAPPSLR